MTEPNVFNNAAYVIKQINAALGGPPVKKTLHKMIYLIQKSGADLGYDYHLYFYGPYSADLDSAVMELVADGVVGMEYTEYGHRLGVKAKTGSVLSEDADEEKVNKVIDYFIGNGWKARKLELLATAVYAHECGAKKDRQGVIEGVKKIKGDKYNDSEIKEVLKEFDFLGLKFE